ncbi:MAG: CHAT domain-containing protein [Holophagales bacterium]|nr:CHAT domain-containing protein [Holophagales bacterium]
MLTLARAAGRRRSGPALRQVGSSRHGRRPAADEPALAVRPGGYRRPKIAGPARHTALAAVWWAAVLIAGFPPSARASGATGDPLPSSAEGVVLEELDGAPALLRAGLQRGDLIRAWSRPSAEPSAAGPDGWSGRLSSAFHWWEMRLDILPNGPLELVGERSGAAMRWVVKPGLAESRVRPALPEEVLAPYRQARDALLDEEADGAELEAGLEAFERARAAAEGAAHETWLAFRLGQLHVDSRRWSEAQAAFGEALELATTDLERARIEIARGLAHHAAREWPPAEAALGAALELALSTWGEGFVAAWCRTYLADLAVSQADHDTAKGLLASVSAFARSLGFDTLLLAGAGVREGSILREKEEFDGAEKVSMRGLEIYERLAPDSLSLTAALSNLGIIAWRRGDLRVAQKRYTRALEVEERVAPGSTELASSYTNLGILAGDRGDLALGAEYYRRALAIFDRLEPGGRRQAIVLFNLGSNAYSRGDLEAAESYYARSLEYFVEHSPEGVELAAVLDNLGLVARQRKRFDEAERHHRRALELRQRNAPEGLAVSISLGNLASVFYERGEPETAEVFYRRSLEMKERLQTGGLGRADVLHGLGKSLVARGADAEARQFFERELAIRRELSPVSRELAEVSHALALLARRAGDLDTASELLGRACEVLEDQMEKLGGSYDARGSFRAKYRHFYRDAIEVSLELGRPELAFRYLERSRTRGLLAMLAERDLAFAADRLPAELSRRRSQLAKEHDRVLREMARLDPETGSGELASLSQDLARLRVERRELVAEIRSASPRLAGLRYPEPLDLERVRTSLDPGTLLLSYSLGTGSGHLFVARRDAGLEVHELEVGEEALRAKVGELLEQIRRSGFARFRRAFEATSRELHGLLIAPAAEAIADAERLLLIPDGPLHALPFAALLGSGPEGARYLVERKPLHLMQSATLYAEIRRRSEARAVSGDDSRSEQLVAFGDPHFPGAEARRQIAEPRLRSASARGLFEWQSLPHSRDEVQAIARHFPQALVRVHLGQAATEERAKALGRGARRVHFATHAWIDDRDPLSSALALTIPENPGGGVENGLLQAWEIFEQVRLDADLVVLSACRSGLGVEQAGEGLIGLSRAFQYAGARSLAVSLWSVDDRSTSELMARFYRHLSAGEPKDLALRAAQLELLRGAPDGAPPGAGDGTGSDFTSPFHWAAFQLIGDWR